MQGRAHTVRALDMARFLIRNVSQRRLPEPLWDPAPAVMMKMDIEGSEYQVLPHLLAGRAICNVNIRLVSLWMTSVCRTDVMRC
jgi:hypothetical protein